MSFCGKCQKMYASRQSLSQHRKRKHPEEGQKVEDLINKAVKKTLIDEMIAPTLVDLKVITPKVYPKQKKMIPKQKKVVPKQVKSESKQKKIPKLVTTIEIQKKTNKNLFHG